MNYFDEWFKSMLSDSPFSWNETIRAEFEYRKFVSPRVLYARVEIVIAPGEGFEIETLAEPPTDNEKHNQVLRDQIIFGVLDVMLTRPVAPIRDFKLTILRIGYDEKDSFPRAFRLAAREAAFKILQQSSFKSR